MRAEEVKRIQIEIKVAKRSERKYLQAAKKALNPKCPAYDKAAEQLVWAAQQRAIWNTMQRLLLELALLPARRDRPGTMGIEDERKESEFKHAYSRENNMSDWNDAIELAAQYCDKLAREAGNDQIGTDIALLKRAYVRAGAHVRELKKPAHKLPSSPSVGRVVHVMIRNGEDSGLHLRPAIITRVGPGRVDQADKPGLIAVQVFLAPEDTTDGRRALTFDALPSPEGGEWKENAWRWPPRV
jgi:hypothetical protein